MEPTHQRGETEAMAKVTILCHPVTPVAPAELEDWLEIQLDQYRSSAPEPIVRLSRLTQDLPSSEIDVGWLIELEWADESGRRDRGDLPDVVADVLTDMRFLGMQPMLLFPHDLSDISVPRAEAPSGRKAVQGPVLDYPGLR